MNLLFRPQKDLLIYAPLSVYFLFGLLFLIGLTSENSVSDLIEVGFLFFGGATLFAVMVLSTKVVFRKNTLSIIIFLFSRHRADINKIDKITYRRHFGGFFEALDIHYLNKQNHRKKMTIGVDAYGHSRVKEE